MKEKLYIFRREDNDELVEVPWCDMIRQDAAGYIEIDGVQAHRCVHLEIERDGERRKTKAPEGSGRQEIVSDSLGFGILQLADFENDRDNNGFSGIEFTQDPQVPEFFQVRCNSRREMDAYTKHRGFYNKTNVSGSALSPEMLQAAIDRHATP